VSFFDVETWAKLAENCYNHGRKGRGVRVVGRLKQERWNGPDGKPRSKVAIVAEHVEFRPEFHRETGQNAASGYDEAENPALAMAMEAEEALEGYESAAF
jgi:single-strand DNA-binding protein